MQRIFQRLFKVTVHEETAENSSCLNSKKITYREDDETRNIILYKQSGFYERRSKRVKGGKHLKPFEFLCGKDVAKACFYSTLNLRRLGSVNRRQHSYWIHKMKKEDQIVHARGLGSSAHKAGHDSAAAAHAGNKVLPISDATTLSTSSANASSINEQCSSSSRLDKDNKKLVKGDPNYKTRTMSRMKELLRWAAAAKSEKGGKFLGRKVLHFRNRGKLKSVPDDDQLSIESPKISFRWDVESCCTTSSAYSGISMASSSSKIKNNNMMISSVSATPVHDITTTTTTHLCTPRKGNWITTDSEFVVLEL